MAIKVGKVNTQAAAQQQHELEKGDRKYWTPSEGSNKIRIMPPPEGYDTYFFKAGFHYGIGPDNKMFACPKVGGARKNCFLCEESDRLQRSKDEEDVAEGKELRPTRKFLITVVDLDKPQDGFQVWSPGVKAFQEVNYYFSDPEWGDVSDLESGFDFIVTRKGSGMNTQYSVKVARKPSDFIEFLQKELKDYSDDMFEDLPKLDEFVDYATDEAMEAEYLGVSSGAKKSSEDDEGESRSRRKSKDEDEEEDTGRGRRTSSRGPAFDDEAETNGADDEDSEDKQAEDEPEERGRSASRSSGRTGSRLRRGLNS